MQLDHAMETLWLLVALLVPLAILPTSALVSEAVLAYVEVPKVTLLRTLVGLLVIAWAFRAALAAEQSPVPANERLLARLKGLLPVGPQR